MSEIQKGHVSVNIVLPIVFIHDIYSMLTNNDILKKLRVALKLRNDDIIEILKLVDFKISRGALGDLFRSPGHPNYVEAGDQILRKFLDGLIIKHRGKMERKASPKISRPGNTPETKKK
jgi:uncharacterized protein YehS (DUF1456 family)